LKVYGIQFDPKWEQKNHNYQEVERMLEAEQIDENSLIVLPETFATGFSLNTEITSSDEPEKTTSFLRQLSIPLPILDTRRHC
jgi:predicted amidohydrolase